jgi:GTP-binding protein EngB required for normal cell division
MAESEKMLEHIAALADQWKLANLQPQILACRNQLHARNGVDVAVFGRFKAGKSSFLNHLTGRAVLPIGVVPLTAVITRLRYGESDRAEVRFLNGATQAIPLADIARYVGENENPNNQKQVASVEVELPALKSLAPMQLVDTPGLGSAFVHNTQAAMNWLPNVGAALVAVSADAPLSERDLALLEELRTHTPRIVLLLTKADLLTEPQRVEVRDFVTAQLRSKWPEQLPVFFYSIKPELSGMKAALQAQLLQPLRERRAEAGEQILRHKLASLRNQTLNYLRIALASAAQAQSVRQALRRQLDEEHRQFELFRDELQIMTRQWSASALEQSLERLRPAQRALEAKVTGQLRAEFRRLNRLRLPSLLQAWRQWLQAFLVRELGEISHTQQAMFCEPVQKAGAHLTRGIRAFHDRLAGHVRAALGVSLSPCEFSLDVREPSAPPVDVNYAFDAAFVSIGWLIPLTLFRKPIERALLGKARYEVAKNLSRLAADWHERVGVVIEALRRQTEEAVRNELDALARMASQDTTNVPRLREQIAELESPQAANYQAIP